MKALLIEPSKKSTDQRRKIFDLDSYTGNHLGLLSIASELKSQNIDVDYFRINDSNDVIFDLQLKLKNSYEYILIATTSFTIEQDSNLAFLARVISPNSLIIMGGYFAWQNPLETLKFTEADIVIRGHGEVPIRELITLNLSKSNISQKISDLKKIKGVCFKINKDYFISEPYLNNNETIKDIKAPDFDIFPWEKYSKENYALLYTSKGCPYSCKFCSVPIFDGKKTLSLDPESIKNQILKLAGYGFKYLYIADPDFNIDNEHLNKVCDMIISIKKQEKISKEVVFTCQARIDHITAEQINKLKEADFFKIHFGIESISPEIINNDLNKSQKLNEDQILDLLIQIKNIGITPVCYFILGSPQTKMKNLKENIKFIKKCSEAKIEFEIGSFIVPFFETPYFKEYKQSNVRFKPINFLRLKEGIIETTPFKIPGFIIPEDKKVYKFILNVRKKANIIRKKSKTAYEDILLDVLIHESNNFI